MKKKNFPSNYFVCLLLNKVDFFSTFVHTCFSKQGRRMIFDTIRIKLQEFFLLKINFFDTRKIKMSIISSRKILKKFSLIFLINKEY